MKKYIFSLILLTCNQTVFANDTCENLSLADKITEIRKNYTHINKNLADYKMLVDNNLEGSSEGGKANYYIDKQGDMVKRVESYYGENNQWFIEYYYHQGDLRFIFTVDTNYNSPISFPNFDKLQSMVTTNHYYFYCNRLIKWLDKDKKSVTPNTQEFSNKEKELLGNVRRGHAIYESDMQARRIFL